MWQYQPSEHVAESGIETVLRVMQISETRHVIVTNTGSHEYTHGPGYNPPNRGDRIQRWLAPDGVTIGWEARWHDQLA